MAAVARAFYDTSVLLAGTMDLGKQAASAQRLMTRLAGGKLPRPATAWHCCLEFYSVATRLPEEYRLSPGDARRLVEDEILARFDVHELPKRGRGPLLATADRERIAGGRMHDLHIAEVARLAGAAVVVTENRRHFSHLMSHGIRVVGAAEYESGLA